MWYVKTKDELYHHGIKGQKWGVRRFQNKDGSVTPAGEKRYYVGGNDQRKPAKSKKKLSKGTKIAIGVAAVTAATTVAVLATRKYNSEKRILDDVLKKHGSNIVNSTQKLSNRLSDLEYGDKYKSLSSKELERRAQRAVSSTENRIAKSRQVAKSGSKIARVVGNSQLDTLATKSRYGNIKNTDVIKAFSSSAAEQGKKAVMKILNAA